MVSSSLSVTSSLFSNNGIKTFLIYDYKLLTNNGNNLQLYGLFNGNLFLGSIFRFINCQFTGNNAYYGSIISIYDTGVDRLISGFNVNFINCNFQNNMAAEAALIYLSYLSQNNGILSIEGGSQIDNFALSKLIFSISWRINFK